MKKKILSFLMAVFLVVTLVPITTSATENKETTWGDLADTSWYDGNEEATEYHITTVEQLAGLAKIVNADPGKTTFAGKYIYLDNDLDLAGHEWVSIGTGNGGLNSSDYGFNGVFDGQGHVISNLYSHDSYIDKDNENNLYRNALFGNVCNGEVRNLGVKDAEIWIDPNDGSAAGKGILVDILRGSKITNCWTSGSVTGGSSIEKNIGGIVGVALRGCTISGCYSSAVLTGNYTNSTGYYKNDYDAFDTIGGIVGAKFDDELTISDCWFDGQIIVNSLYAGVGGILGYTEGGTTIKNCMVATTDIGSDKDVDTGWVAYALAGTFENNYIPADDKYTAYAIVEEPGMAVADFNSEDVLEGLRKYQGESVEWVAGINHPTFKWDGENISADYSAVEAAIAKANALNRNDYKDFSGVDAAVKAVVYGKSINHQTEVDAMAKAIESAIAALEKKQASVETLKKINGKWYYIKDGKQDLTVTKLVKYGTKWYYVKNGVVDFTATTLVKQNTKWYYVKNGVIDFTFTGLTKYNNTWFYVYKGVVNFNSETLVKYNTRWYYVKNGRVDFKYTGNVTYKGSVYYVKNGVMQKKVK